MKKQFRFSKDAEKLKSKKVNIITSISVAEALSVIEQSCNIDKIPDIVKIIDLDSEDWGVTEECFKYFAEEMLKFETDDDEKLSEKTKQLITNLYNKYCK